MPNLMPWIVLLVIGLIVSYTPMDGTLKRICMIVLGIVALLMLLRFANLL
jgi:hypothetical protein